MTQKERLVDYIVGFPMTDSIKVTGTDCVLISRRDAEDLADKLIDANGVIMPPCKVGDVVYCVALQSVAPFIKQETVERIQYTGQGFYYGMQKGIYFEDEVFFTREEAEKALKEREKK